MADRRFTRRSVLGAVGAVSLASTALAAAAASLPTGEGEAFRLVLSLEPSQAGKGNHRWARIGAGLARGSLQGEIQSGRVDWQVDPASGAVEATATCSLRCADGKVRQLRRGNLAAARLDNGLVVLRAFD